MYLIRTTQPLDQLNSQKVELMSDFYSFKPLDSKENPFDFAELKGKVVLIVNAASKCGFAHQYRELEALYRKHKDRGLVVLAFPCNQFGCQEPGSAEDIAKFCSENYGVTFPVLNKVMVNGSCPEPLYTWLKNQKSGFMGFLGIKWNFEKFLIDATGQVVGRWSSLTTPIRIEPMIETCLQNIPKKTGDSKLESS